MNCAGSSCSLRSSHLWWGFCSFVSFVFVRKHSTPNLGHLLLTQNNKSEANICWVRRFTIEVYSVGSRAEARLSTLFRYGGRPFLISVPVKSHPKPQVGATSGIQNTQNRFGMSPFIHQFKSSFFGGEMVTRWWELSQSERREWFQALSQCSHSPPPPPRRFERNHLFSSFPINFAGDSRNTTRSRPKSQTVSAGMKRRTSGARELSETVSWKIGANNQSLAYF